MLDVSYDVLYDIGLVDVYTNKHDANNRTKISILIHVSP